MNKSSLLISIKLGISIIVGFIITILCFIAIALLIHPGYETTFHIILICILYSTTIFFIFLWNKVKSKWVYSMLALPIFCTLILIGILPPGYSRGRALHIVVPDNYVGEFYIIEDRINFQTSHEGIRAFENFGDLIYFLYENKNEIRVRDITIFNYRPVTFGYMGVAPVNRDRINIIWKNEGKIKIVANDY